jgi:hypothetical protein
MSLTAFYQGCAFPKGKPRIVAQLTKQRTASKEEQACRAKVDARDGRRCFWPGCKVRASDKHHIQARSLGGKWLTRNILSACRKHHDYFKAGLITVTGNPDRGPVKVRLTQMGKDAKLRIPTRAA